MQTLASPSGPSARMHGHAAALPVVSPSAPATTAAATAAAAAATFMEAVEQKYCQDALSFCISGGAKLFFHYGQASARKAPRRVAPHTEANQSQAGHPLHKEEIQGPHSIAFSIPFAPASKTNDISQTTKGKHTSKTPPEGPAPLPDGTISVTESLRAVSLTDTRLRPAPSDFHAALGKFPHLASLDLTNCNLVDWSHVLSIVAALPALRVLSLSSNPLQQLSGPLTAAPLPISASEAPLPAIHELKLVNLALEPETLRTVLGHPVFRDLHSLFLTKNPSLFAALPQHHHHHDHLGGSFPASMEGFFGSCALANIRVLDASHCGIQSSHTVTGMCGWMANLEKLNLSFNDLSTACVCADCSSAPRFQRLTHVNLASNALASWTAVDGFVALFAAAHSFRLHDNPIAQSKHLCHFHGCGAPRPGEERQDCTAAVSSTAPGRPSSVVDEFRWLTIAKYPQITWLNGAEISASEKKDSETAFIRHFSESWKSALQRGSASVWTEQLTRPSYSRYEELISTHSLVQSHALDAEYQGRPSILLNDDLNPVVKLVLPDKRVAKYALPTNASLLFLRDAFETHGMIPAADQCILFEALSEDGKRVIYVEDLTYFRDGFPLWRLNIRSGDRFRVLHRKL